MRDLSVRALEEERMDDPALAPETYEAVMRDLARVNRVTMARRPTLSFLDRALCGRRKFRLLDVGFGDGDMLRAIAGWANRRGIAADLVGVDLNPSSAPAARAHTPPDLTIDWRTGDYAAFAGEGFDLVISSLVAHHMTHAQLVAFLRFMESEARIGWFVNDLHRHPAAYHAIRVLARMSPSEMFRHDAPLSVLRGFSRAELRRAARDAGLVHDLAWRWAFRWVLVARKPASR